MIEHDLLCPQGADDGLPCYCTLIGTVREDQARECNAPQVSDLKPLQLVGAVLAWNDGHARPWLAGMGPDRIMEATECARDLGLM